jgi:hypothetical protein
MILILIAIQTKLLSQSNVDIECNDIDFDCNTNDITFAMKYSINFSIPYWKIYVLYFYVQAH